MVDETLDTEHQFFERQLVIFSVGKEEFGVDINDVREIIKLGNVTEIPNSENYVLGVINLRGKIIVVVDLAQKLGITGHDHDKNTRVIITEIEGNTVGMVVDSCNEVLRITGDKIEPAPPTITQKISADYIQGVGILGERLLILLDLGCVMESETMTHLNNIKDTHTNTTKSGKKKILIVEDSSMMRATLKSYIPQNNYTILEAEDGEKGLNLAKSENPDLILLDIKLPKMSGVDVLKNLATSGTTSTIIMETSVYEDQTKDECLKLGAKAYLKKPVNKKQITDILKEI